ncbi:MAG: autotransporter-associated beta strand repeat-containing protein [Kiritimatiellia bacterium]
MRGALRSGRRPGQAGTGTFNLTGGNTFTGGVTLNNGTAKAIPSMAATGVGQARWGRAPPPSSWRTRPPGGHRRRRSHWGLVLTGSLATLSVGTTLNMSGNIVSSGNNSISSR